MSDLHLDFVDYKKIFKNQDTRLKIESKLGFIPTIPYLKAVYWIKTGKKLDLKTPKTFSEKINWLKINDVHPEYSKYVDKYEFKRIVSDIFGEEHVFKLLGVWENFDDIDFGLLPDSFVLKCTHDSGSIKIVKNKTQINKSELKKFFDGRLKINSYNLAREYPYKNVKPRIIAEEFHKTPEGKIVNDYRIFCFNGVPKIGYKLSDRYGDEMENWFDMDFNPVNIIDPTNPSAAQSIKKPSCFEEMINAAKILSKDIKFVRVDFYEENGNFYFGEMTFFPYGGFIILQPEEWDKKLGDWIDLK